MAPGVLDVKPVCAVAEPVGPSIPVEELGYIDEFGRPIGFSTYSGAAIRYGDMHLTGCMGCHAIVGMDVINARNRDQYYDRVAFVSGTMRLGGRSGIRCGRRSGYSLRRERRRRRN